MVHSSSKPVYFVVTDAAPDWEPTTEWEGYRIYRDSPVVEAAWIELSSEMATIRPTPAIAPGENAAAVNFAAPETAIEQFPSPRFSAKTGFSADNFSTFSSASHAFRSSGFVGPTSFQDRRQRLQPDAIKQLMSLLVEFWFGQESAATPKFFQSCQLSSAEHVGTIPNPGDRFVLCRENRDRFPLGSTEHLLDWLQADPQLDETQARDAQVGKAPVPPHQAPLDQAFQDKSSNSPASQDQTVGSQLPAPPAPTPQPPALLDCLTNSLADQGLQPLVVGEIAQDNLAQALDLQKHCYARMGIPEYWVIDVPGRRVFAFHLQDHGEYRELSHSQVLAGFPISLLQRSLHQLSHHSPEAVMAWLAHKLQILGR